MKVPLTAGEVWANDYQLAMDDAEEHFEEGRHLWSRWKLTSQPSPRFMACRYGSDNQFYKRPEVIVPIPEGGQPCELDIRSRNRNFTEWEVRTFVCAGPAFAKPVLYFPHRPDRKTQLGGIALEMSRSSIKEQIIALGGTITVEDEATIHIRLSTEAYVIHFAPGNVTPHQISTLRPPRRDVNDHDLYLELLFRFGTPWRGYAYPDHYWTGGDDVWVVHRVGAPGEPQQIILMDHAPGAR
ncbi:MAG: hypothetical protein HY985_05590 [Magnetospirillum sp.]|nr:hypothetical protein [Magnetospirillum sp.]